MSKCDIRHQYECQNRILKVKILYSARIRMSKNEKRKAKNESKERKTKSKQISPLTEYRKTKKQTHFTLLIYWIVSCIPKQGFQLNSGLHLISSHWICNVKAKDEVSSATLLSKPGIQGLALVLRTSRMRWFGHVERCTGWIAKVRKLNVVAQKRPDRPKKTWDDRKKLGMNFADPMNRSEWRGRLRGRLVKQAQPSVEEESL